MTTQPAECTGIQVIPAEEGPDVAACTKPGCTCKTPAQITKRYVEPGFTAAMLADIPDEEPF